MSSIISHHLKNRIGIRKNLNELVKLFSTTPADLLRPHRTLPHVRPRSSLPHITPYSTLTNQYDRVEYFQEKSQNRKIDWPATFLVFDIETTGFHRSEDRIIEVALRDCSGGVGSTFESLVNPEGVRICAKALRCHYITTHMVNQPGIPTIEELIPIMLTFVKSRQIPGKPVVFVAHFGKQFDFQFLKNNFLRCGYELPDDWLFLDTRNLFKHVKAITGSINLDVLREFLKVASQGPAHRAMADVNVLTCVLSKLSIEQKLTPMDLLEKSIPGSEISPKSVVLV